MAVPDRIKWAVDLLDVRSDDVILEIGCGDGNAVGPICERLIEGRITAIDRSEKMIDLASRNNREWIERGRAEFLNASIETAQLPSGFSKVFLFNLNVFWMDPIAELKAIGRVMSRAGQFFIFHNPPPGSEMNEYAEAITANLAKNNFKPEAPTYNYEVASLCIRSMRAPNPR